MNQRKTFTTERIGLRYINIFNTEKIKILKKFFISEVANALTLNISNKDSDLKTIRSMHLSEYSMGNSSVNFRFGLYNKLYPNPIQTNDFVLDYDCFSTEGFSNSDDIIKFISEGHDLIQNLFEGSITNSLREFMKHG